MNKTILSFFLTIAIFTQCFGGTAKSVSQFGVTWTFDKPYEVGHFANGDWWVVGPVTIIKIDPITNKGMHGSMINPLINTPLAFDIRMQRNKYSKELNVARKLPLLISKPSSLMSSISFLKDTTKNYPQLKTMAILTVLTEAPPENSFRPPYQGDDKAIVGSSANLNFNALAKFPPLEDSPSDFKKLAKLFERPWIELKLTWVGRYTHPKENQRPYGRDLARKMNRGLLALQLDYSDKEKRALLINIIQVGIDIYGAARLGGAWRADGGHNPGRKMPLILAGVVLNNQEILAYADAKKHLIFQEDQQTFYVTQAEVDVTHSSEWKPDKRAKAIPYTAKDIGMPEWGIRHSYTPKADTRDWKAKYRGINNGLIPEAVLCARLMKVEKIWNHKALFAYADRVMKIDKGQSRAKTNCFPKWGVHLWEKFYEESVSKPKENKH